MEVKLPKKHVPSTIEILWKPFVIFFAVLYIGFNWPNISWLFNYKVAGQYINDLKPEEKPAVIVENSPTEVKMQPTQGSEDPKEESGATAVKKQPVDPIKNGGAKKSFGISIAKIGIEAPIVLSDTTDNTIIHKYLDSGVVMYPGGTMPGQNGDMILLGHSAPPGWPKIKYDWVFSRLNDLKAGDIVKLGYNGQNFNYEVVKTVFLMPGEELPTTDPNKNTAFLVSCWPPGKDFKRIVVETVLQD